MEIIWNYLVVVGALMLLAGGACGCLLMITKAAAYEAQARRLNAESSAMAHTVNKQHSDQRLAKAFVAMMNAVYEHIHQWDDGFERRRELTPISDAASQALYDLQQGATADQAIAAIVRAVEGKPIVTYDQVKAQIATRAEKIEAVLQYLLDHGDWYHSAIEIDTYDPSGRLNGDQLLEMAKDAINGKGAT